jgi:hypothetical protein
LIATPVINVPFLQIIAPSLARDLLADARAKDMMFSNGHTSFDLTFQKDIV